MYAHSEQHLQIDMFAKVKQVRETGTTVALVFDQDSGASEIPRTGSAQCIYRYWT